MEAVVQLVSELFMIVLCIIAGPADQREVRIDVVEEQGVVASLIVRREDDKPDRCLDIRSLDTCTHPDGTEKGFAVYNEGEGEKAVLLRVGTIRPVKGKKDVYICTVDAFIKGLRVGVRREMVNLPDSLIDIDSESFPLDLRRTGTRSLKFIDGSEIRLNHSGSVVYLTPTAQKRTYAVH